MRKIVRGRTGASMAGSAVRHGRLMVSVNESSLSKKGAFTLLFPPQQMPPLGYLSQEGCDPDVFPLS
ncbi:uncharacterized [Tachysurus ichikawai]